MDFAVSTTSALDRVLVREGFAAGIDLVITDREWGLEVNFEDESLSDTLRALRLDEAAKSVDEIAREPLATGLATLVEVFPQLFRASES